MRTALEYMVTGTADYLFQAMPSAAVHLEFPVSFRTKSYDTTPTVRNLMASEKTPFGK